MITEEVFRGFIDAVVLDGNKFDRSVIEKMHDDIGRPFSGEEITAKSAKEIIVRYFIKHGGVRPTNG